MTITSHNTAPTKKTALVTGGGVRIGQDMALHLAKAEWAVVIHCRHSLDQAQKTVAQINNGGGHAALVQADLDDPHQVDDLISRAQEAIGDPITLLVNSASTFEDDNAETFTRESWYRHMNSNLYAPVMLSRDMAAALPDRGLIINMLDQRVVHTKVNYFSYSIAKSALWTATKMLARTYAPRLRVNAIAPGMMLKSDAVPEERFAALLAATPMARPLELSDIRRALDFIIHTEGLTGHMIPIDGGEHLT
ncbi:MAG: SDR family oxidoreductase [Pseudomonadota bacterium]